MSIYEESGFFFPEKLEAVLAPQCRIAEVNGKLKAVESTWRREKGLAETAISLHQDPSQPVTDARAKNGESPESLTGAARKRFMIAEAATGILRHRESPSCQRPKP